MRLLVPLMLLLAGCAGNSQGKWPSLAPRAGEVSPDMGSEAPGKCAGCSLGEVAPPPPAPPAGAPLPADVDSRLEETERSLAAIEAKAPPQAKAATAAILASRTNPAKSGDAEVERSRYEALFMPLSIDDRRLEALADDVAGRDGADAVQARIEALRSRITALQAARASLPE